MFAILENFQQEKKKSQIMITPYYLKGFEHQLRSKEDNAITFFSKESWNVTFFKSETQDTSKRHHETLFQFEYFLIYFIFILVELREA